MRAVQVPRCGALIVYRNPMLPDPNLVTARPGVIGVNRRLVVAEPRGDKRGANENEHTYDSVSLVFAAKPISDRMRFLDTAEHQFYVGIAVSHLVKSVTTEQDCNLVRFWIEVKW
jgi:hypothetical protein